MAIPRSAAPFHPPLLIGGGVIFIGGSEYGVFVAEAVGNPIIFCLSFLIFTLFYVLILPWLRREFDRLGGDGAMHGWAASNGACWAASNSRIAWAEWRACD